ncbi:hypothetical protein [Nitratireductor pacificus]|nr:hypothetical protein [Nitratireductor pacificus]
MHEELKPTEQAAFDRANRGIELGVDAKHAQSLEEWRAATEIVGSGDVREDLAQWVKSGYGAALYDTGAYAEAIEIALETLQWSEAQRSVLSLLTVARSQLALGYTDAAKPYLQKIHERIGADIYEQFEDDKHATIRSAL